MQNNGPSRNRSAFDDPPREPIARTVDPDVEVDKPEAAKPGAPETARPEDRPGALHPWPRAAQTDAQPAAVGHAAAMGVVVPQPAINAAFAVMLLIGMIFVGVGAVALGRGGFNELNLHNSVMGIPHTPLLGFLELLLGATIIFAAALPQAARWVLLGAGGLLFLVGLIFVITPGTFEEALGVEALNGWLYMVAGGIVGLIGVVMPRTAGWRAGA